METNVMAFEPIAKINKDIKQALASLSDQEARYLVDAYYQIQEYRKAVDNQVRSMDSEPTMTLTWLADNMRGLENQVKRALNVYTDNTPEGQWLKSICGIGPVIAAGLAAHIDITKAPTAGHIWRFAGLDPTSEWMASSEAIKVVNDNCHEHDKNVSEEEFYAVCAAVNRQPANIRNLMKDVAGNVLPMTRKNLSKAISRRPWNAALKTLCWKIGESFVKVSAREDDIYGKYYIQRKELEQAKNEAGDFKAQAEAKLSKYNIGKTTEAYKWYSQGKLPPAHIHARAKRYAVKLFLSHYHHVAYKLHFKKEPPLPYPIAIQGHAHMIEPPK